MINKNIDCIIWDLDNTLYPYDKCFLKEARSASVIAAGILAPDIDFRVSIKAIRNTQSVGVMAEYFTSEYNLDRDAFFSQFYNNLDPGFLKPDPSFIDAFKKAPQKHVLLTHASSVWAKKATKHLGLYDDFDHILAVEDIGGALKNKTQHPYNIALQRAGVEPENTVFIDDHEENLVIAKTLGMLTILLGEDQHNEADMIFKKPIEALYKINAQQTEVKNKPGPSP
jgi:putative hydrolase of the HAD superfamily